jgi:hypothetical protein
MSQENRTRVTVNMRLALPNASFIGFTGTPLVKHDELTRRTEVPDEPRNPRRAAPRSDRRRRHVAPGEGLPQLNQVILAV